MEPIGYLLGLAACLGIAGLVESIVLDRKIRGIASRIHVSGTRGKSSVCRLIAAGLNGNGIRTAAKTTGTLPRMICPDSSELPVFRPSGANIMEQARIVSLAREMDVQALVVECMALQPELHWISESKFIKATHGVITNIRPDHLDVMGPGTRDVALALSSMIPLRGKLYTAEQKHLDVLKYACEDRKSELISVSKDEALSVSSEELSRLPYIEHPENLALSLRLLSDFGITRSRGIEAMSAVNPDPGVLTEYELDFFGRKIVFVNAFAANDPESTLSIVERSRKKHSKLERLVVVLNLREDRPLRTMQFAEEVKVWSDACKLILLGQGAYLFSRLASEKQELQGNRFIYTEQDSVEDVFEKVIDACGKSALVIGVGNIAGMGLPLARLFKNRALL